MKKAYIFVFGGLSTLLLSMFLLVLVPRLQAGEVERAGLSAQVPYNELQARGRAVYLEYGCIYCHSQQVRDPVAGADASFGWGPPARPSDYIYDRPHLLGTSRTGPDLANIGARQPSPEWHHLHLYDPRSLVSWSIMPGFPFLYEKVSSQLSGIAFRGRHPASRRRSRVAAAIRGRQGAGGVSSLSQTRGRAGGSSGGRKGAAFPAMSHPFEEDLLEREKPDLMEADSATYLLVPKALWVALAIFGVSYLALQTSDAYLSEGDKRSSRAAATAVAQDPRLGATLYKKNCQACHQPGGLGVSTAFPPLAGSEWVQGDPETISAIVLHGISGPIEVKGVSYKGVMPAFQGKLSPAEIAAVTSYVRASWGNQAAPIEVATVEEMARKTSDRGGPWKGGAELKEQPWNK